MNKPIEQTVLATVNTPEFNLLLGTYAAASVDSYTNAHAELVAHIDAHAAAVAAKAVGTLQVAYDAALAELRNITSHEDFAELGIVPVAFQIASAPAPAPQQHAQAALSGEQIARLRRVLDPSLGAKIVEAEDLALANAALFGQQPAAAPAIDRAAIHRKVLAADMDGPDVVGPTVCTVPPPGWACTRAPGHDGPCAAIPAAAPAVQVQAGQHVTIDGPTFRALPQLRILNKNSMDALIAYVDAALASQASKGVWLPEDWQLVPIHLTSAMVEAGANADPGRESVWSAYLAAAPSPMGCSNEDDGYDITAWENHPRTVALYDAMQKWRGGGYIINEKRLLDYLFGEEISIDSAVYPDESKAVQPVADAEPTSAIALKGFLGASNEDGSQFSVAQPSTAQGDALSQYSYDELFKAIQAATDARGPISVSVDEFRRTLAAKPVEGV